MQLRELLTPERTLAHSSESTKKETIERLSNLLAQNIPDIEDVEIFESICARERLGSTNLGHGVALPHARLKDLEHPIAALIHLQNGIEFDAAEAGSVDLIFGLLVPEDATDEQLKILAIIAELFSRENVRKLFRTSTDSAELYHHFINYKIK